MKESGYYALANAGRMNVFFTCIKNRQGELSGNIVNSYLEEPVEFAGILGLGLKIDTLRARLCRPVATTESRFLDAYTKKAYEKRELDREHTPLKYCIEIQNMNRLMAIDTTAYETSVAGVHQRQFSSIQGRTEGRCIEGNYISSRSVLELMKMLHEYEYT